MMDEDKAQEALQAVAERWSCYPDACDDCEHGKYEREYYDSLQTPPVRSCQEVMALVHGALEE